MVFACWHQAITWNNVDLNWIEQDMLKNLICNMIYKITLLKSLPHISGQQGDNQTS